MRPGIQEAVSPLKDASADSVVDINNISPHVNVSDFCDVRRRSLRQLGVTPVETGFPYYSPAKANNSTKGSPKPRVVEDEECSVGSHSNSNADCPNGSNTSEKGIDSSMSMDESSKSPLQNSAQPLSQKDSLSSGGSKTAGANKTSVRRQVFKAWEDRRQGLKMWKDNPSVGVDERLKLPSSVAAAKQASEMVSEVDTVFMLSPNEQQQSSIEQDGHTRETDEVENERFRSDDNNVSVWDCTVVVDRDLGGTFEQKGLGAQPQGVVIDCKGLVGVYERVVRNTENCSIARMEKLHSIFEQLVFNNRMRRDKEALLSVGILTLGDMFQ